MSERSSSGALIAGAAIAFGIFALLVGQSSTSASTAAPGGSPPVPVPGPGPSPTPPPGQTTSQVVVVPVGSKILLVGDSLAVGLAPTFKALATQDGYVPTASAVSGTTISYWAGKLPALLAKEQPQLVLVSLGTNDSVGSVFASEGGALAAIVKMVGDAGALLVWIGPPELPRNTNLTGQDQVRAGIQAESPWYFDSQTVDLPLSQRDAAQRIHPSASGYAKWMSALWAWLQAQIVVA